MYLTKSTIFFLEEANKPADLSKPIIFKKTKAPEESVNAESPPNKKVKKSKKEQKKAVLSFNDEENEDDENE